MDYSGVNQTIGNIDSDGEAALLQLLTAADGAITMQPPKRAPDRGKLAYDCNIENTNGNAAPIATIQLNGIGNPINIVLPDNRVAATLTVQTHFASINLSGSVGPNGDEFIVKDNNTCIAMFTGQLQIGCNIEEGGKPVFSLVPPNHYWVLPFLIGTACLGACCVNCMVSGPMYNIDMAGETRGTVTQKSQCSPGPMYVESQNIIALRASISALTLVKYKHCYCSDAG